MAKLSGMVVADTMPVYSYDWLCEKMCDRSRVLIRTTDGKSHIGLINGIRPEDGSGRHWLVTICCDDHTNKTVYVRTA